jgi:site-specific recombinase XerD
MIQAGYPPKMLQEIMGHAGITTTSTYAATSAPATWTVTQTASTVLLIRPVRAKSDQMS